VADRLVSGSFLHNATVSLFDRRGFERTRRLGKNRRVVARDVPAPGPPIGHECYGVVPRAGSNSST
jgi:hypothetical protein